mmetsp:Transcript_25291/g.45541  ORF Transcript_25291/g.45541 Transcript_25291/m.45541 type:complete len:716 (-) Transcript_25291:191-2338(-)|eukprot:CAMPEP_0201892020 /NCGR_PEP_ID=MMETSP0902-20130614/35634_1 /ASSEMBLY_ACC=CAM_ASM_000551 /TAXON_ID=420261 /ORGANISM="Thalassiosira antarctica, Strain CCMP982" /LENGTH=715 /DNA_ID=CAMNT_0048423373 /DNA_START=68 /DNA_END=2215 /DNA_ORIENTATION=+
MSGSGSFDGHQRDEEHTSPSTLGLVSASQLSTPVMSQQRALALILNTPPANNGCADNNNGASLKHDFDTEEAPIALPPFSSQQTPSLFSSQYDTLEPPAWKPPAAEEIEYTDAWNNIYNNQHHYLQPGFNQDDSTIGSSQTNTSLTNNVSINAPNILRPRGLSLCSYGDDPSISSVPQPQAGHAQHRRHPSLPVSFFSSASYQGSLSHQLFPTQEGNQNQPHNASKQCLNLLQSTTKSTPYELYSHHNVSQVQADGAMAGLNGILLDLYVVDRTVDSATAKMLATNEEDGAARASENEKDNSTFRKKGDKQSSSQKPRKTSIGTLNDIQCILELHKLDKIVDRFKQDLQMPQFFEEEAWERNVWKDLRRTDVEMEEYAQKKKLKESNKGTQREGHGGQRKEQILCQFDLGDEEEEGWNNGKELGGEDVYLSAESHLTDYDAYQFFDPHETDVLQANSYQSTQVSASINDDLHEVIDLLRTDAEVDGASKHQSEMAMMRPLLKIDREMNKWKERSEVKTMWDGDLRALYLTDLEVDGATRKYASKPQKVVVETIAADVEVKTAIIDTANQQDPMPPIHTTNSSTALEVKDMLSQHIPQVSQPNCPTSPALMATKPTAQAADLALPPPLPTSRQPTRRSIFSTHEKSHANIKPKAAPPTRRSIFSRQEKSSATSQCAFQRGVMMPGTTTVVMAGGEMIDDIPVGKVIITGATGAAIR